ncbi:MAG: SIMPL domain-containing protein [Candidatus Acidiferrales bacterium]
MNGKLGLFGALLLIPMVGARAQEIQISRENKTIAVTVTESVEAEPEIAEITVGFRNYGLTQDSAFSENIQASDRILEALSKLGIPKESIETEAVELHAAFDEDWPKEWQKERKFEAVQLWRIRVSVASAQNVVDTSAQAGANQIGGVQWTVRDQAALQAKAYSAALGKSRGLADAMANGLGGRLGGLIYASNTEPVRRAFVGYLGGVRSAVATQTRAELKLFPQKVKEEATVYAVFALD